MKHNIDNIINQKNEIIDTLISQLQSTSDYCEGNQIALALIDHFKDERIENCLFYLINDAKWKNKNGTLLYALDEYTDNSKYLYFLIDLLLKNEQENDGEIFMSAYSMLVNLKPPFEKKEITKSLRRVRRERKKSKLSAHTKKIIISLTDFLEGQREINKFYSRFGEEKL